MWIGVERVRGRGGWGLGDVWVDCVWHSLVLSFGLYLDLCGWLSIATMAFEWNCARTPLNLHM